MTTKHAQPIKISDMVYVLALVFGTLFVASFLVGIAQADSKSSADSKQIHDPRGGGAVQYGYPPAGINKK